MVTCELCGRELKNTQGLRGHKNFYHKECSFSNTPVTTTAIMRQGNELEDRLDKLEYITGLREPSILDKYLYAEMPLLGRLDEITERLSNTTEQMNSLAQQIISLINDTPSNTEYREIKNQVTQLAQRLTETNKWFSPVYPEADTMSHFEHELSNRAKNIRVHALENRLAQLEEEQKETAGNVDRCIRDNKAFADIQIEKLMEVI